MCKLLFFRVCDAVQSVGTGAISQTTRRHIPKESLFIVTAVWSARDHHQPHLCNELVTVPTVASNYDISKEFSEHCTFQTAVNVSFQKPLTAVARFPTSTPFPVTAGCSVCGETGGLTSQLPPHAHLCPGFLTTVHLARYSGHTPGKRA